MHFLRIYKKSKFQTLNTKSMSCKVNNPLTTSASKKSRISVKPPTLAKQETF